MNDLTLDRMFIRLNEKDKIDYNDRFKVYQIMKYKKLGIMQLYHLGLNMNLVPNLFENTEFEDALLSVYYSMCTHMDITEMNLFKYMKHDMYAKLVAFCVQSLDNNKEHLMMIIYNTLYLIDIMYEKDIFDKINIDDLIIDEEAIITLIRMLTCLETDDFINICNRVWNKLFKCSKYHDEFISSLPKNKYIKKHILMNTDSILYKIVDKIINRIDRR